MADDLTGDLEFPARAEWLDSATDEPELFLAAIDEALFYSDEALNRADEALRLSEEAAGQRAVRRREREYKRAVVWLRVHSPQSRTRLMPRRLMPRRRESHSRRPGHRRITSTGAGPTSSDEGPAEPPRLRLVPKRGAIYSFDCLSPSQRGAGTPVAA